MPNYMYHKLKVQVWNNLVTHQKYLATHKCVTTPWLRTTGLVTSLLNCKNIVFALLQQKRIRVKFLLKRFDNKVIHQNCISRLLQILCDLHFADMALMESSDFMQQLRNFKPQSLGCAVARRKSSTTLIFPLPPQACSGNVLFNN
jgi:hypothetical protein